MVKFNQVVVPLPPGQEPSPLKDLQIQHPIVYRRGPINQSRTAVISPAKWIDKKLKDTPKLIRDDFEAPGPSADCSFCYPDPLGGVDPGFLWSEATWACNKKHEPLPGGPFFQGIHPAYYMRFHQVLFRKDQHVTRLYQLLLQGKKKPAYIEEFLHALCRCAKQVSKQRGIEKSTLIGGVSFALSFAHFHINMGVVPSWVAESCAYGSDYWKHFTVKEMIDRSKSTYKKVGGYGKYAGECSKIGGFPAAPNLVVHDGPRCLWVVSFAGKSEHECTIFMKRANALADLDNADRIELSKIIWSILCYYQSIGDPEDVKQPDKVNAFLLGFFSQVSTSDASGRLVIEMVPQRKLGYLEMCHGCCVHNDWPENVAAKLRGLWDLQKKRRVLDLNQAKAFCFRPGII